MPEKMSKKVIDRECQASRLMPMCGRNILQPIKIRIMARAGLRYVNLLTAAANKK